MHYNYCVLVLLKLEFDIFHHRLSMTHALVQRFQKRYPPQSITPNHSGQFTPFIIMKSLKYKFRASWHSGLIGSNKLEFYRTIKHSFTKEAYLDHVKVYADRSNLTRLRISAHRLEIEVGRWHSHNRKRISLHQ